MKYLVIRCGDIPDVRNATYEEVTTPYLPGSTTVRYQCMENYQFTGGSTINCQKNGGYASWTNGVKCIPGIQQASSLRRFFQIKPLTNNISQSFTKTLLFFSKNCQFGAIC
jgi:hypothetical protein